jgi:hypothetical protein
MATKEKAADILLALLVEVGGLVVITAVAGISDEVANLMMVFVVGVGILWMIQHTAELGKLTGYLANAEKVG